jgi:hypothetical protein
MSTPPLSTADHLELGLAHQDSAAQVKEKKKSKKRKRNKEDTTAAQHIKTRPDLDMDSTQSQDTTADIKHTIFKSSKSPSKNVTSVVKPKKIEKKEVVSKGRDVEQHKKTKKRRRHASVEGDGSMDMSLSLFLSSRSTWRAKRTKHLTSTARERHPLPLRKMTWSTTHAHPSARSFPRLNSRNLMAGRSHHESEEIRTELSLTRTKSPCVMIPARRQLATNSDRKRPLSTSSLMSLTLSP